MTIYSLDILIFIFPQKVLIATLWSTVAVFILQRRKLRFWLAHHLFKDIKQVNSVIRFRIPQSVWLQRLSCLYTAPSWALDRVVVRTGWASAPGPQPYIPGFLRTRTWVGLWCLTLSTHLVLGHLLGPSKTYGGLRAAAYMVWATDHILVYQAFSLISWLAGDHVNVNRNSPWRGLSSVLIGGRQSIFRIFPRTFVFHDWVTWTHSLPFSFSHSRVTWRSKSSRNTLAQFICVGSGLFVPRFLGLWVASLNPKSRACRTRQTRVRMHQHGTRTSAY